jgi:hypothetical protein
MGALRKIKNAGSRQHAAMEERMIKNPVVDWLAKTNIKNMLQLS